MRCRSIEVALLTAACVTAAGAQARWNQFRGSDGRGIASDDRPLPATLDRERNLLWERAVPGGHSSPCVWDDRIFVTGFTPASDGDTAATGDARADGERGDAAPAGTFETLCIDRRTGAVRWRRTVPARSLEKLHRVNSAASPTPTADGERVFAYFGSFGLLCYDFAGQELWRRPMPLPSNTFGTGASPIIAGDHLILARDTNRESFVEAIDPATGETRWRRDREGFRSGWSTPVMWRRDGVDEILVYGAWWLTAYALADGAERWSVPGLTDEPTITPVTGEGMVFVTSYNMNTNPEVIGLPPFSKLLAEHDTDGDGRLNREEAAQNQSVLSRHDADGEGDHPLRIFFRFLDEDESGDLEADEWQKMFRWLGQYRHKNAVLAIRPGAGGASEGGADRAAAARAREPEIVWQFSRGVPECPSPLYYEGRVYVVKNGGLITCLRAATGELVFEGRTGARGPHYASPVAGDGKVYTASAPGVVAVVQAGDTLKVLARNDLGERIMATPALVDGVVYVRTGRHLLAFGAR